jgi:hypothetical protein
MYSKESQDFVRASNGDGQPHVRWRCAQVFLQRTGIVTSCPELRQEPNFDENCYR